MKSGRRLLIGQARAAALLALATASAATAARLAARGEVVTFEGRAEMRPRSPTEIELLE